jgi:hypothetical protein
MKDQDTYSEEETKRRAEATLKVMLATPHRPHKPTGLTPSKTKKTKEKADESPTRKPRSSNR